MTASLRSLVVLEGRIILDALGIALLHQHRLADAVGGFGERDLGAALRIDEHAGGDDVEAAGLQARDERAEFGEHAVDLRDAHLGEHRLGDFRRFAGELAVWRGEAEGRLVGEADADEALRLGALERRLGKRDAGQAIVVTPIADCRAACRDVKSINLTFMRVSLPVCWRNAFSHFDSCIQLNWMIAQVMM